MSLLFAFLLILSCNCSLLLAKNKSCSLLVGELGDGQSKFVYCATTKSVPVRLCIGCGPEYRILTSSYDALLSQENCSKIYLNSDRINVVATTQGILTNLWQKANCEDCFNGNHSDLYDVKWNILNGCLSVHKDDPCISCKNDYIALNQFYLEMEKANKGHVCFDLQDSMNRTRSNWSKTLGCCHRDVKLNTFLIAVCVVVLLPIVTFYITVIVLTKRREANHGLLNEETPELDAPSTSALITAAVLSTPTENPVVVADRTEKIAKLLSGARAGSDSDLDSSDDEISVKPKTA
ncbi:osteopetrosis-associated transmembrane protein 1 [Drosophila pseudoobscura]|uniref:Osteopetrosis-associated transmembrane protein 1 n=1 Tax=Drosophila pseudoobscura pseudoobscura TaxID=46245 RepID=A0A6I8UBE7_DROPS|nr:osteopetrosis-associated transmembrane protein 1 [Drosophila pseudoobscura]